MGFKKILSHLVLLWMLSKGFRFGISCSVFMWRFGKIQSYASIAMTTIFLEFRNVTFLTT